jgi:hypothetical protein
MATARPTACRRITPAAGRANTRLILTPTPKEKIWLPSFHCRNWKQYIVRKSANTTKQSLKRRRRNMLCSRLDRTSIGRRYGGAWIRFVSTLVSAHNGTL